jgi:hypothetical protein
VNGAGYELLADTGLTENQHRGVARRHLAHLVKDVQQRIRAADDVLEAVLVADLLAQVNVFFLEAILEEGELGDGEFEFSSSALKLLFGFTAFGDIRAHAEKTFHLAVDAPQHDAAPSDHFPVAVASDQETLVLRLGITLEPPIDGRPHVIALVFVDELEVMTAGHFLSRISRDILGKRIHRDDPSLPIQCHHEELNTIKKLPPPALVGDHFARKFRCTDEVLRQVPAHSGDDQQEGKGVGAWYVQPAHVRWDDGEKPQRIDHQTEAEEASLATLSATGHANGAVEENQQKAEKREVANDPQRVCGAGKISDFLSPRQSHNAQRDRSSIGDPDDEVQHHRQHPQSTHAPQEPTTGRAGSELDVPRQGNDRRHDEERGPRHPGEKLLSGRRAIVPALEDCIAGNSECRDCEQELQPAVLDPQRREEVLQAHHDANRSRRNVGNRKRRHQVGAPEITEIL